MRYFGEEPTREEKMPFGEVTLYEIIQEDFRPPYVRVVDIRTELVNKTAVVILQAPRTSPSSRELARRRPPTHRRKNPPERRYPGSAHCQDWRRRGDFRCAASRQLRSVQREVVGFNDRREEFPLIHHLVIYPLNLMKAMHLEPTVRVFNDLVYIKDKLRQKEKGTLGQHSLCQSMQPEVRSVGSGQHSRTSKKYLKKLNSPAKMG